MSTHKDHEHNLFVELHALVSHAPSNLNRDDLGAPKTAVFGGVRRLRISSQCQKRSWRTADIFRKELGAERERIGIRTSRLGDQVSELLLDEPLDDIAQRGFSALLSSIGKKDASTDDEKKPNDGGEGEGREEEVDASSTETAHLLYLSGDEHAAVAAFIRAERKALSGIGALLKIATDADEKASVDAKAKAGAENQANESATGPEKATQTSKQVQKRNTKPKKGPRSGDGQRKEAGEAIESLRERLEKHLVAYVPRSAVDVALFGRFLTKSEFREIDAAMQVAHAIGTQKAEIEYDYFTAIDDRSGEAAAGHIGEAELGASVFYKYAACDTASLCRNLGPSEKEALHAKKNAEAKKKVDAHRADARVTAARALKGIAFAVASVVPTGKKNSTAPQNRADYLEVVVRRDAPLSLANAFLEPVRADGAHDVMDTSIRKLREKADTYGMMYGSDATVSRFVLSSYEVKESEPRNGAGPRTICDSLKDLGEKLEALLLKELPA